MSSINNKIIAAVACLAATTLAYPASGSSVSARQSKTDCPVGSGLVFYNCANGYWGCFKTDPCALPPLENTQAPTSVPAAIPAPTTIPISMPTSVPTSNLAPSTVVHACPVDTTTPTKYFEPEMYNLSPEYPDLSQPEPVNYIYVRTNDTESKLEQAMVFRGIPANAKQCILGWNQVAISDGRNMTVKSNGAVWVESLTGFPAADEPISVNSLAPYETGRNSTADFTNWDKVADKRDNTVRTVDCAEELYFKLEINVNNVATKFGTVLFEQDFQNGFYLSYTC